MHDEPTPDELEAQMRASEAEMEELASMLESEADLLGLLAKEQGRELAAQAQEHLPLVAGGAAAVGLLLALLLRGGDGDEAYEGGVPVRELDDDYVSLLARVIRHRLRQDDAMPLGEALAKTLREQAPVVFRRPPEPDTSSSSWGRRLLGMGVLAAVGVGANYAAKQLTGQGLVDLVTGRSSSQVPSRPAPVGTSGGRVPDPTKPPAAADALGRSQPTAAPKTPPPSAPRAAEPTPPPEPPAAPEAPASPTDRTEARSEPDGAFDEVHGTSGGEMPAPDDVSTQKAPKEGMPAAAEGAEGATDPSEDLAEPQGELPGEPPESTKKQKKGKKPKK